MANLSRDYEADRGQLILVTAFMLAVTFVALALVVNSAIFTENMATRDDVAGSHEALDFRSEVEANAGELLTRVNNDSSLDTDGMNTTFKNAIGNLSEEGGLHQASQGRLVNVSWDKNDAVWGTMIAQHNPSRNFSSESYVDDWTPTTDSVETVRKFKINVTDVASGNKFSLVANDTDDPSTEEWGMEIDKNSGYLNVTVYLDGVAEGECARKHDGSTTIDITAGTVGGKPCVPLGQLQDASGTKQWFAANIDDDYRIEFQGGGAINGTYSFVLADETAYDGTELESDSDKGKPYYTDAIYSVLVSYEFYTPDVGYETDIRVAPGEVSS